MSTMGAESSGTEAVARVEYHQERGATPERGRTGRLATVRDAIGAFVGAVLALLPHVMHHVGLLAGVAFATGAAGNVALFVVGLVLSIPLLRRLYRRFRTWRAPAIAVGVFAAVFSLSAFVIGPAFFGGSSDDPSPPPSQDHSSHHG